MLYIQCLARRIDSLHLNMYAGFSIVKECLDCCTSYYRIIGLQSKKLQYSKPTNEERPDGRGGPSYPRPVTMDGRTAREAATQKETIR